MTPMKRVNERECSEIGFPGDNEDVKKKVL